MSCSRNGNKARLAAVRAGIGALSSQAGNVAGSFSNRVLNVVDREGPMAKRMRQPVRRTVTGLALRGAAFVALRAGAIAGIAAGPVGWAALGAAMGFSATARHIYPDRKKGPLSTQTVRRGPGPLKRAVNVPVYRDKVRPQRRVFRVARRNWEIRPRQSPGGGAYTQLVAKTLPRQHFYFKGRLSDRQAVRVAAGALKPEKTPGYVGRVTDREALMPAWASAKHGLIRASLE